MAKASSFDGVTTYRPSVGLTSVSDHHRFTFKTGVTDLYRIETDYIQHLRKQIYYLELETAYLRRERVCGRAADGKLLISLENFTKCDAQVGNAAISPPVPLIEDDQIALRVKSVAERLEKAHGMLTMKADVDKDVIEKLTEENERLLQLVIVSKEAGCKEVLSNHDVKPMNIIPESVDVSMEKFTAHGQTQLPSSLAVEEALVLQPVASSSDAATNTSCTEGLNIIPENCIIGKDKLISELQKDLIASQFVITDIERKVSDLQTQLIKSQDETKRLSQELDDKSAALLAVQVQLWEKQSSPMTSFVDWRGQNKNASISEATADKEDTVRSFADGTQNMKTYVSKDNETDEPDTRQTFEDSCHRNETTKTDESAVAISREKLEELTTLQQKAEADNTALGTRLSKLATLQDNTEKSNGFLSDQLSNMSALLTRLEEDNSQLRLDNDSLLKLATSLKTQLHDKDEIAEELNGRIQVLESKLKKLEKLKQLYSSLNSDTWEEFSRIAESMKSLSKTLTMEVFENSTNQSSEITGSPNRLQQ